MTDAHESQASETTSRKHLSDAEILAYTSADPFALTSTKPWLYETKSPYLRKIAIGWVVLVMAIHIFMGVTLDVSFTGAAVTTIDKFAFPGVGVLISILSALVSTHGRLCMGCPSQRGSVWPASSFPISSSFLSGHCSLVTNKT